MNKFELKFWHPIAGLALAQLFKIITENLGNPAFQPLFTDIYNWTSNIFVVLLIYIIIRNIYHAIIGEPINPEEYDFEYQHTKPPQPSKMEQINRELDEIEASLDAISSNEKVTPIWELPKKKP